MKTGFLGAYISKANDKNTLVKRTRESLGVFASAINAMMDDPRFRRDPRDNVARQRYEAFRAENNYVKIVHGREYKLPDYDKLIENNVELLKNYESLREIVSKYQTYSDSEVKNNYREGFLNISSIYAKIMTSDTVLKITIDSNKKLKEEGVGQEMLLAYVRNSNYTQSEKNETTNKTTNSNNFINGYTNLLKLRCEFSRGFSDQTLSM